MRESSGSFVALQCLIMNKIQSGRLNSGGDLKVGSLNGYKIVELAGIGPAPMGGMILADMGAEVIRIERVAPNDQKVLDPISGRGKKSVALDLKAKNARAALLTLIQNADVLIDPYRPGVCEKLGLSPDECFNRNARLVFARMTGWGQKGSLAHTAGHDLNYIAITGALHAIGRRREKPVVPLNLIGDFGGGGMLLVNGILGALLEAGKSGKGQVVDVAMVDGTAQLLWMMQELQQKGSWNTEERESNLLDGAAPFYDTYECSDGKYVAIGSIEPQFYSLLLEKAEIKDPEFLNQYEVTQWPDLKLKMSQIISTRTRDEWCQIMQGTDACLAPVLTIEEATQYPPNVERRLYTDVQGFTHPSPAPRFSRTPSMIRHGARVPGADTAEVLESIGVAVPIINEMLKDGSAYQA